MRHIVIVTALALALVAAAGGTAAALLMGGGETAVEGPTDNTLPLPPNPPPSPV
jgi:hypothetical protein